MSAAGRYAAGSDRLLLTGATGFLGSCLLARLMRLGFASSMLLLARGSDPAAALARIGARLEALGIDPRPLTPRQILLGDLLEDAPWRDPRLGSVRGVAHLAANTSFGGDPAIERVNIDGSARLLEACRGMRRLERVLYVGTAMSCGRRPPGLVGEDEPYAGREHLVRYTSSKAACEAMIAERFCDLPVVIARPSIVVGHAQLGCQPSGSIFWAFRALDALGMGVWDMDGRIDVVPADYVAAALARLLLKRRLACTRYHISAGTRSSSWDEIARAFSSARGEAFRRYRRTDHAGIRALRGRFPELLGEGNPLFLLRGIRAYFEFAALGLSFDNRRLLAEGCSPPPPFHSYLPRCVATSPLTISEQMLIDFGW